MLALAPDDEVLEIGCGPGVAVALVCDELVGGRITAIDRSATAIDRAARRNADHLASGKAVLLHVDLAGLALPGQHFDKVLAVNVNLFWVRPTAAELQVLADLMHPDGVLHLIYETPGEHQANRVTTTVTAALQRHGFATATTTADAGSLLCITATLPHRRRSDGARG